MVWLRKSLILAHRYVGIALSLMFLMWFVTGIGMIYSRGMPRLTPQVRLSRLDPLQLDAVKLTPGEAAERGNLADDLDGPGRRVTLLTVNARPAYRFGNSATVYADTGEFMEPIDAPAAMRTAAKFLGMTGDQVRFVGEVTEPDQWTLTLARDLPLYKVEANDADHTELYISPDTAEVVQLTTRASRILSWVSVIPHFLYFTALRTSNVWWLRAMTWLPAMACVLAVLGIVLGFVQLRRKKPRVPYAGWMRWHHISGLVFGVLTLTWAFSGLLSMEPWDWSEQDEVGQTIQEAFSNAPMDLASYPRVDAAAWTTILNGRQAKEIEFSRVLDEPTYIVRTSPDDTSLAGWPDGGHQPYFVSRNPEASRFVVPVKSMTESRETLEVGALVNRLTRATPDVPVVETEALTSYDSYYYSRDGQAPLPVVRIKLGDARQTWVYVDPEVAQVVGHVNRMNRVERWLYNGLHNLDFSFLYYNRPLWDGVVILLSLGGVAVSGIGFFLGMKRLWRGAQRTAKSFVTGLMR